MSHPLLTPQFLDETEITASAQELLAEDFVGELGLTLDDPNNTSESLKESVQNAMAMANFSPDVTQELIQYLFESPDTHFAPFSSKANDNARRFGFSSIKSLKAAATEKAFNPKLRCYEFELSVSTLVGLARSTPLILTDQAAHYYRSLLAKFCRTTTRRVSSVHPRVEQIAGKTRRNAIQLLTCQPQSCSLNKLAKEEITLRRFTPRKKVSLVLNTMNKQQLRLDQLAVFNCFLCPATAGESITPANVHESLAGFAREDSTIPHINYKRLFPYDGAKAVFHHIHDQHTTSIGGDDSCSLVIPCKACVQEHIANPVQTPLDSAFVCCAECGLDHSLILHSTTNRLLGLYSSLEADFRRNTAAKHHLEHFLLTQCFICGALFKTKELMQSHQLVCMASFSCLSSGFGRPLASEIFFTTSFIKGKEDEECLSHALEQLTGLVRELRGSIPDPKNPLTQRAASALSSLIAPANPQQNPTMIDGKGKGKGKGGKRGSSKSSKTAVTSALGMPPGLEDDDDDDDDDDDGNDVQPASPSCLLTNPRTIHPPRNNDGTDNTSNQRDYLEEEEEERIWIEAARLETSLEQQELDRTAGYDDDDAASTVLKFKEEQTLADASCSPPPAKKKQTL